ncbi:response regulator transcription factor [Oryzifoliimicrobium ureilyticus]|uniref:response regulator transcription factor n=1 Tax=Oryzifoliimicrobium ureilyticus TaxID=3113724 RepID=UPI003075FA93
MAYKILVVDDEPHIRDVICFALEREGMATSTASNGAAAVMNFRPGNVDLIILDIGMPEMDGLEVCRRIRKISPCPILFLSARDEEIDRIVGFELGGDDYVTKPFSPRELVARVKAILKRSTKSTSDSFETSSSRDVSIGPITLSRSSRSVMFEDNPVNLTALEFSILEALLSRPDMVFERGQLMQAAYGHNVYVADRTIDSHIRNIRAKFAEVGGQAVIATVHGVGFKLARSDGRSP